MNEIAMEKTVRDETLKDICDEIQMRLGAAWSSAQSINAALTGEGMKLENETEVCPDCLTSQLNLLRRRACELSDVLVKIYGRIC